MGVGPSYEEGIGRRGPTDQEDRDKGGSAWFSWEFSNVKEAHMTHRNHRNELEPNVPVETEERFALSGQVGPISAPKWVHFARLSPPVAAELLLDQLLQRCRFGLLRLASQGFDHREHIRAAGNGPLDVDLRDV